MYINQSHQCEHCDVSKDEVMIAKREASEYETDEDSSLRERVNQERSKTKMQRRTESFNNVQSQSGQTFNSITDTEKFDSIDEVMKNRSVSFETVRSSRNSSSISLAPFIQKNQQKRQSRGKTSMQPIRAVEEDGKMFDFSS